MLAHLEALLRSSSLLASLGSVQSKCCPFVALDADHDDEKQGHDGPAEDDVHHEEATRVDHVVLDYFVRARLRGQVITRANCTRVTQAHDVHRDEDCVGQCAREFLRRSRDGLQSRRQGQIAQTTSRCSGVEDES